jgi:D-glycero-alpha-D-manno-heptose-7-phosphate kinase
MGSSSSFTVGLLHALYALKGQISSKQQLATESIHIEQERLRETVGSQDQVLAAHGGLNHIIFSSSGDIRVEPVTVSAERINELNDHLMLFYTGIKRTASDIAGTYVEDIATKERQMVPLMEMVREGLSVLNSDQDLNRFGELLDEAWKAKSAMGDRVTNSEVDEIYAAAQSAGAIGGKLLGAGGGGFMVLFAPPSLQSRVQEKLNQLIHVPFEFESAGSQIIYLDHEVDYSKAERVRSNQFVQAFRELAPLRDSE